MSQPPRKKRRSLSHVGGAVETAGDPTDAARLARALDVTPSTDADDGCWSSGCAPSRP